jgi:hypothetical protein
MFPNGKAYVAMGGHCHWPIPLDFTTDNAFQTKRHGLVPPTSPWPRETAPTPTTFSTPAIFLVNVTANDVSAAVI